MEDITQIGLRAQSALNNKLEAKAREVGISKNALILVLIDLGWKIYENLNQASQQE